jgi:CRP-like cAMP-binding protein
MGEGALGREYGDGEVICRQGEPGDRMYVVQAGRALVVHEANGREVQLTELSAGDVFGEMAIFDRKPRSATVRAKGPARVLTLDKRAFLRGVHEDPSLAYRILREMSQRIRRLTEELSRLKQSPAVRAMYPDGPRYLLLLPQEQAGLCELLSRALSQEPAIEVLLDRRGGERRQRAEGQTPSRRRADRRRSEQGSSLVTVMIRSNL